MDQKKMRQTFEYKKKKICDLAGHSWFHKIQMLTLP